MNEMTTEEEQTKADSVKLIEVLVDAVESIKPSEDAMISFIGITICATRTSFTCKEWDVAKAWLTECMNGDVGGN